MPTPPRRERAKRSRANSDAALQRRPAEPKTLRPVAEAATLARPRGGHRCPTAVRGNELGDSRVGVLGTRGSEWIGRLNRARGRRGMRRAAPEAAWSTRKNLAVRDVGLAGDSRERRCRRRIRRDPGPCAPMAAGGGCDSRRRRCLGRQRRRFMQVEPANLAQVIMRAGCRGGRARLDEGCWRRRTPFPR